MALPTPGQRYADNDIHVNDARAVPDRGGSFLTDSLDKLHNMHTKINQRCDKKGTEGEILRF